MLPLEADHFAQPSRRAGFVEFEKSFMQIAGIITGQSRVPSSGPGLICE
jgi:hypothetical protein